MKKQILSLFLIVISLFGLLYVVYSLNPKPKAEVLAAKFDKTALIYFYGNTCSHCRELTDWINAHKIESKVKLQKKEVYQNQENSQMLQQAAEICQLDTTRIGVPFIYDNGKCYQGTPDAEAILKKKAKI